MKFLIKWLLTGMVSYAALCTLLTTGSVLLTPNCAEVTRTYDIAVVLGGGMDRDPRVRAARTGRSHAGVALYQRGIVQHLHMTGAGGGPESRDASAIFMASIALDAGISEAFVSVETSSSSTLQNVLFSRAYLPPDKSLLIVTEDFHAWRSWASFAWVGIPGAVCAAPKPIRATRSHTLLLMREVGAWAFNIPRAAIWSLGQALGLGDGMPGDLLA